MSDTVSQGYRESVTNHVNLYKPTRLKASA